MSNFGDVVLTLPVIDGLRAQYPHARITVMVGPRAAGIFENSPYIHNLIVYDKYVQLRKKIDLFFRLKQQNFDVIIDLRNTLFGVLLSAKLKTSPFLQLPLRLRHMRDRNLYRLKKALGLTSIPGVKEKSFYVPQEDKDYIAGLLDKAGVKDSDELIIVSPVAAGLTKRWDKEKFLQVCRQILRTHTIILIGRKEDKSVAEYIQSNCPQASFASDASCAGKILNFTGLTNLSQLAGLFLKASLVVSCDTGILHLGSYLDVPIVGVYGPTDERRYGPWASEFKVVKSAVSCRPCGKPECRFNTAECMQKVGVGEVLDSIDALLKS